MTTKAIGYGLGHKVYPVANVLRTFGRNGGKGPQLMASYLPN